MVTVYRLVPVLIEIVFEFPFGILGFYDSFFNVFRRIGAHQTVGGMEEVITKINLYQKALASGMTISLQQRLAFARTMEKR